MNKNVKKLVLSLSVLIACSCAAYADGNAFTPLNFEDAYTNSSTIRTTATTTSAKPANTVAKTSTTTSSEEKAEVETTKNEETKTTEETKKK